MTDKQSPPETIAAIATPPGRGGIGVVRVSGALTLDIARSVVGPLPKPRTAVLRYFHGAQHDRLDRGIVLLYRAPQSYTGEDMVEFQGHGGPVVLDMVLTATIEAGARLAEPGEFTQRAFLNGKLELSQAEAVADLIASHSEAEARAAQRTLAGELAAVVSTLAQRIVVLRAVVETAIDFSDEENELLARVEIERRLNDLSHSLCELINSATGSMILREGMRVVIAGAPNVGKSSLLNRLAGRDTAIVTELPGTTRDLLNAHFDLNGVPIELTDTAGLHHTTDPIEREGIRRAKHVFGVADLALVVVEDQPGLDSEVARIGHQLPAGSARIIVRNKADLSGAPVGYVANQDYPELRLCALTGEGIDLLKHEIATAGVYHVPSGSVFLARRRHVEALERARRAIETAQLSTAQLEVVAEELRCAQRAMAELSGEVTTDDLLEEIFSSFCIGK